MRCAAVKPFTAKQRPCGPFFCRVSHYQRLGNGSPYLRGTSRLFASDGEGPELGKVGEAPAEEVKELAALRRQQQPVLKDSNIVQGALEEAQLITWPKPQKAVLDTVLVLAIVIVSGALLFGLNVLLTEVSEWWYHLA